MSSILEIQLDFLLLALPLRLCLIGLLPDSHAVFVHIDLEAVGRGGASPTRFACE